MDYKILSKLILDCINEQSGDGSALIISKNFTEMADAFNDYLIDNNRTDEFYIDEENLEMDKDFSVQFLSEQSMEESITFGNSQYASGCDHSFYDLVIYYDFREI